MIKSKWMREHTTRIEIGMTHCLRFKFLRGSVSLRLHKWCHQHCALGMVGDNNIPSELNGRPMDGEHGVSTVGVSDYFLHFLCGCLPDYRRQFLHNLEFAGNPFSAKNKAEKYTVYLRAIYSLHGGREFRTRHLGCSRKDQVLQG
jgi:hypothetical protein